MASALKIISSEEILRKYYESGIETLLPTFKLVTREYRVLKRRTEIYFNRKTRRKMLVKVFDEVEEEKQTDLQPSKPDEQSQPEPKKERKEKMCVTWLRDGETEYMADRP